MLWSVSGRERAGKYPLSQVQMPSPIRLIVGLGNPGAEYAESRHNAGFWFVDHLARLYGGSFTRETKFHGHTCRIRIGGVACWLLKPATFMNRSGQSVSAMVSYYRLPPEEMLVVHDELDLAPGVVRLKQGGGHAGHNGLRDIVSAIGGRDFWRLRIGIGHPGDSREVVSYVLGRPARCDTAEIEAALVKTTEIIGKLLLGDFQYAMHQLHTTG